MLEGLSPTRFTKIAIASGVSPGLAGVVIASASVFVMDVYYMMQGYTDMEQSMNSIERIQEYMDVPSEPPAIVESNRPPAYWPSNSGDVVVENLVLRYAPELDPVLRGLTFTIKVCTIYIYRSRTHVFLAVLVLMRSVG